MITDTLMSTSTTLDMVLGGAGRRCAQAAAVLTVAGAAALGTFFAVGEPWGTINDASAIALAATTVPIAVGLARRNPRSMALTLGAGLDAIGAVTTSAFTALLIARQMTFDGEPARRDGRPGPDRLLAPARRSRRPGRIPRRGDWRPSRSRAAPASSPRRSGSRRAGWRARSAYAGFAAALIGTVGAYAVLGRRSRR